MSELATGRPGAKLRADHLRYLTLPHPPRYRRQT
jgi:hypothetical protein